MALPSSGSLGASQINTELGRSASAGFSMNGAAERALAGKPSGSISFSDFHGKASEISVNMAAGSSPITLQAHFTAADWVSETTKRVILPAGVERGSTNGAPAVTVGPAAWGGNLIFEVRGVISGTGGGPNSSVGGNALHADRVGSANQKLQLILSGTLRGGGGGGGRGGNGGAGSAVSSVRDPATGYHAEYYWQVAYVPFGNQNFSVVIYKGGSSWATVYQGSSEAAAFAITQYASAEGTWFRGPSQGRWDGEIGDWGETFYMYRTINSTVNTSGGAGGSGGNGEGYAWARGAGAGGAAGGTNAGTGGTGGAGGLYGQPGGTGATGNNGNAGAGAGGAAGGAPGYGLLGTSNVTLTNNGAILGRTG